MTKPKMKLSLSDQSSAKMYDPMMRLIPSISSSNHHDHNQTYPYTCLVTTNIENYRRRRPNTNDDSSIDSSTCYHQRSSSSKPMTKTKTVISIDHHNQRYCHHDRSPTSKRTRRRESWSSTSSTSIFSSRKRIGRIAMLTFVTCLMLFHDIVIQPLMFVNALTEDVNNGTIRRRRDDSHSFVHYPLPPPAAFSQSYVAPAGCEWRARSASSHLFGNMVSSSSSSSTSSSSITSTEPSSPNEMLLTCRLRTLNGALDSGANLSLIPSDRTAGLALICDDLLFESSLPNRSFERLHQLRELHIDQCKLSELAPELLYGLIELRQLTIRTRNTEWGDLSLRIPANLFHTVRLLEQLDLSENGIQQLPSSLFCPMSRLQFVNVSSNSIGDVASFGFSAKSSSSSSSNNHDQSSSSVISNMNGECRRLDSIIHLDASSNRIKVLTDRGFGRLQRLQILTLRHNLIVRAEETSLAGLNELSRLDLSNNQLVALPARFFQAVKLSLAELYMQNNSISVIPPGLFSGLSQVTILDLAHNEVTSHWIGPNTFADMTRLMSLDLSYNKLTRIDSTAFRGLFTLQSLSLQHNDIESLAENAFAANRNLHTLSLSGNRLTSLDAASFAGLEVLNALALDFNRILHVHPLSFANISGLIELNLAGNRLEAIPIAIGSLHMIRSLDLSYNRIRDIGNASYQGLEQLYSLNLEGNQIGNLTRGDFEDLPSLRVLNMAHNRIGSVEVGTFEDIIDLHALRLDSNSIEYINSLFPSLAHLMMLNISANRIEQFDYAMIPFALIWLDIHSNRIETLGNFYAVESELKLRTLDASGNRIGEIEDASLPNSIELVLLNRNAIRKIAPHTFAKKTNLTRVDLSENRLTSLDLNSLRLAPIQERRPLPEFSIAGNPFLCDCNMEWLQRAAITIRTTTTINDDPHQQQQQQQLQQQPNSRLYPRVVDAHMVNCRLPFGRISGQMDRSNGSSQSSLMTPIVSLRSNQFLCSYRSHCFTLCHCCEFDACDCEMTCPDNCSCFYDQSWSTNIVDCGVNNHLVVPARIPMDVTDLYLDGNDISELSPHTFIGRKNLRHLHLNSSHIRSINNRTFNGLKSLLVLNLADNELDQLYGYEFERLSDLRELYLQSNRLTSIHNRTFSALRSLKVLRLDHNRIIEFELWTGLAHAVHLTDLYVGYNDWSCECHFVGNMIEWLPMRSDIVRDLSAVHCRYNETYSLPLAIMDHHQASSFNSDSFESIESARANISAACSHYAKRESIAAQSTIVLGTNGILTTSSSTSSEISSAGLMPPFSVPVIVLVIASTFGILILLASIVTAVLYRHELSVWFYARTGIRLGSRHHRSGHSGSSGRGGRRKGGKGRNRRGRDYVGDDHDEKLFDAFVSYSKKDEAFVQQLLAPELEVGSTPMRLCLHYRDLPVASGFVADAIVEAMAASRRTILVISEHFLRGEWTHYEFKTAHQEALRSRARHKLILIFVGPVAGKDLDPDIRVWLKTAGNTCLQWGEKMFWEKLRYALPEIPASATSTSSGTGSSSSNSSTTSSSYGRKISSGGGGNGGGGGILTTLSKGGTLPALSSLTSQSPLTMSRNAIDSYGHHGHLQHIPPSAAHHPLLAQHHQQQHLTLGRTTMAHPYNLYQQQQQQQQSQSALYSPSSIHSQQSTYAYPTYHPPGNLLNDHHRASSHQSTPPPLPPAHPLQQHLQQQQQQQQQMTVPAPNQPPPPIPHLTGTGLYHLDQHHNVGHHQQQQQHHHHHRGGGLNSSSNESSLITNSTTMSNASHNGSIDSDRHSSNHGQTGQPGQPVTPFVPSATSTTAVAVHI